MMVKVRVHVRPVPGSGADGREGGLARDRNRLICRIMPVLQSPRWVDRDEWLVLAKASVGHTAGVSEELQPGDPGRIGPFRVVGRLGSGGMGQVFLGRSAGGRPVAVKVIRADLAADREFRARFRREVEAAQKVSGFHTALLVDADVDGPVPWLATAYVPGPSLADAVAGHGPLPAGSVLMLAAGLAESVAAIHAAGVVHRDLKPSNVLLADDGPRVIDFGISRAAEASALTGTGLVIGSPGYMSPEQAEGGQVGPPSDVFSLGAVLAYAAAGRGPFGAGSTAALIYRVVHAAPALDGIAADLRELISCCLAKDPATRPAAQDLLAELGDVDVTAGWLPAPLAREVSGQAHSSPGSAASARAAQEPGSRDQGRALQVTSTAARARPAPATRNREPAAFGPTMTQPSADRSGRDVPPHDPALAATLADPASGPVYAVAFAPDGGTLAAAGASGQIRLWDAASGTLARTLSGPGSRGVIGVEFCPDGELLAAADASGRAYLWDLVSGELARTLARRGSHGLSSVAFGLAGDVLAAASDNGHIYMWDVVSGKLAARFGNPASRGVPCVTFDRDTELLAAADDNGRVYLWDVLTGKPAGQLEDPASRGVTDIAFGQDGDLLAAADASGKVNIWDMTSGRLDRTAGTPSSTAIHAVAFAPGGGTLAAGDADGRVHLWDTADGQPVSTFENPGSQAANSVAFSPRGDLLAAADGNGQTYLWETSAQAGRQHPRPWPLSDDTG